MNATGWSRGLEVTGGMGIVSHAGLARCGNCQTGRAWAQAAARHGALPPVQVADKTLDGVTCIRLDATVVPAHSDKELAEPTSPS